MDNKLLERLVAKPAGDGVAMVLTAGARSMAHALRETWLHKDYRSTVTASGKTFTVERTDGFTYTLEITKIKITKVEETAGK